MGTMRTPRRGFFSATLAYVLNQQAQPLAAESTVVLRGAASGKADEQLATSGGVARNGSAAEVRRVSGSGPSTNAPSFVTPDDTPILSKQEVLFGVIVLEGQMMMQLVAEIGVCVKRTLSELVGVPQSYIILSISSEFPQDSHNSLYGPTLTTTFRYILLPLNGRTDEASRVILESGAQPSPPFLSRLALCMRQNENLEWMSAMVVDEWRIEARLPTKSRIDVEYPADYSLTQTPSLVKATTGSTTPQPASDAQCKQALHPCSCAALSRCAWVSNSNGISSCVGGSSTSIVGVSCSACAAQERCPAAACARVRDPCYCAVSDANCRWNEAISTCEKNNGAGTSCIACAAQSHCDPPQIVSFHPPSGSKLSAQTGSRIRVAFDRDLVFMSSPGAVELRCYGEALAVGIPYGHMKLEANVLIIDVASVTATYNGNAVRRCSLVVGERIVAGQDGVPFLGMTDGEYALLFGDSVAPKVLDFSPRNGELDVAPSTVVTLTFSEPIVLGPAAAMKSAQLSRLEAGETVSSVEDVKLSPPRVAVDSTRLKVDLTGMAEAGIHYTLSLPSGAVADLSQNEFGGLPIRAYAFRTAPEVLRTGHTSGTKDVNPTTLKIIAAAGGAVLLALCVLVVWRICRLRQIQKSYLQTARSRSGSRLNTVRPSLQETDRPSVLRHTSSASLGVPQTPETEVPLDAFEPSLNSSDSEFSKTAESFRKVNSWASEPLGRHNSTRSSRTSSRSVHSASDPARKQWAQQVQATRKWHQAFAKAAAARKGTEAFKSAHASPAEPQYGSRHTTRSSSPPSKDRPQGPYSRRQTWTAGQSPTQSPKSSTTGSGSSPEGDAEWKSASGGANATSGAAGRGSSKRSRSPVPPGTTGAADHGTTRGSSSPGPAGTAKGARAQSKHSDQGGSQSDFDARRSSKNSTGSRTSTDVATGFSPDDPEPLKQQKREVLKRMRTLMDSPLAERKKVLRELMLEYHPDKNSDQYAKEIFQFINANRSWFLSET